jgi:hypothetical protein
MSDLVKTKLSDDHTLFLGQTDFESFSIGLWAGTEPGQWVAWLDCATDRTKMPAPIDADDPKRSAYEQAAHHLRTSAGIDAVPFERLRWEH